MARQEAVLADVLPGAQAFRDQLEAKGRRGRHANCLKERDELLRVTARKRDELTVIAAPPVIAWTMAGWLECIASIQTRGGVLRVIEPPLVIGPEADVLALHQAAAAWTASKTKETAADRGKKGGRASASKRADASLAKIGVIRERWLFGDPKAHRTADLLAEVQISRNTVVSRLGKRRKA